MAWMDGREFAGARPCASLETSWGCPNNRAAASQLNSRYPTGVRRLGFRALWSTDTFLNTEVTR